MTETLLDARGLKCPLPVLRRPYEDMEWSLVEKAEREIHGNGLKLKWLHEMGEPLLYARIDDAIRLFPEASLSTNGLVLTPEIGGALDPLGTFGAPGALVFATQASASSTTASPDRSLRGRPSVPRGRVSP